MATAVLLVVLGRGRLLSLLAALLAALLVRPGGTVFSLTTTAERLPFTWAVDPALFDEAAGRALVGTCTNSCTPSGPRSSGRRSQVAGRDRRRRGGGSGGRTPGRTAPWWFVLTGWAYVAVFALVPIDGLGETVVMADYVLQLCLLGGIGWFALRTGRGWPAAG